MSDLTVACVLVCGHVDFTSEYVIRLKSMCRRMVARPHRFVCFTDDKFRLPDDIETVHIPTPRGHYAWWSKLELFNAAHGFTGRVLYLDLDVLLVRELSPIIDFPARFALVPDGAPNFRPRNGLAVYKKFNSSVMVWEAGEANYLYDAWTPKVAQRLWGDQDWIGEMADAESMPREWFPRLSECGKDWGEQARVVLCKKPKNLDAAHKWPWFNEVWQ